MEMRLLHNPVIKAPNMDSINKKGDHLNPDIIFDQKSGNLSIRGKSIPLNTHSFLADVISWLELYSKNPQDTTSLEIDLKYMNGSSVRSLLAILYRMKAISDSGKYVKVQWNVPSDADDIIDLSEEILSNLDIPHDISLN